MSCVQYPVGTWFAGPSFGQTTLTSWRSGTTVTTSFEETTQTSLLPMLGSSATRTTIPQNAFAEGKTEWKPIVVKSNGPYLLTTDGNSGNFGLEQYPSTTLGGSGLNFVVISGKIFSGFSRGHFRRLAIVGVQDGAEVTMSTGTSSQQFSLNTAQAKIIRIDAGSIPIRLTSTKPVQMFDLGEEAREGIAVALPLADSSVTASVTKVSSSIPVVSAGTDEATNANAAVESPSSGPWQTAWAWMQKTTRSVGTWIQTAARSTGTFFASLYTSIRDFFVSGQALRILQTATQSINDLAVRLFLPLSALVLPILKRVAPSASMTSELVAVWMFWTIVVLALIILILALRPRHNAGKRLPRVTPRIPGQGENPIDFGLVEQGPKPSPAASLDQLARTHEKQEMPPVHEVVSKPAIAEELSPARLESPSVPEISLEPLGFFGEAETAPAASTDTAATIVPAVAPLLEFTPPEAEPPTAQVEPSETPPTISELPSTVPPDVPLEALLTPPQEDLSALEVPVEQPAQEAFSVPELRPIGEEAPIQTIEPESHVPDTVMPLDQPLPVEKASMTEATFETEEAPVPEAPAIPLAASIEEPGSAQETNAPVPVEAVPVEAVPVEAVPVEAVPVEAVPVEAVPVEAVPVEAVPVEAVPVEAVPVEAVPVEAVPVEAVPVKQSLLKQSLLKQSLLKQSLLKQSLLKQSLLKQSLLKQSLLKQSLLKQKAKPPWHRPVPTSSQDYWMMNSLLSGRWLRPAPQQAHLLLHLPSRLLQHASRRRSPRSSLVMSSSTSCFRTASLPMPGRWHSCSAVGIATGSRNWPSRPRTCRTCPRRCDR